SPSRRPRRRPPGGSPAVILVDTDLRDLRQRQQHHERHGDRRHDDLRQRHVGAPKTKNSTLSARPKKPATTAWRSGSRTVTVAVPASATTTSTTSCSAVIAGPRAGHASRPPWRGRAP